MLVAGQSVETCLQYLHQKAAPATHWGFWRLADCASRVRPRVVRLALLESGSESLVCTLDAPDRRSPAFYPFKSNRPTVMHSNGPKTPSAGHSTNDSAVMGLIAAAEALGNAEIRSQWAASLLDDAAPAAQLLSSGYSAPKPICCGPVGRRRFPESLGSPRPAAPPWRWVVLSPPIGWWAFPGRSFLRSRGGPNSHLGIVPRRVLCAAGGGAAVWRLAGSRRDQTAGKDGFTWWHARTGQMRMCEARSRVPHVTSRQDSKFNVRHVSTVHRSPTINPHYPLMLLPSTSNPCHKVQGLQTAIT